MTSLTTLRGRLSLPKAMMSSLPTLIRRESRTRLQILVSRPSLPPVPLAVHRHRKLLRLLRQSLRRVACFVCSAVRTLTATTAAIVAAARVMVARLVRRGPGCSDCFAERDLIQRRAGARQLNAPLMGLRRVSVRARAGPKRSGPMQNQMLLIRTAKWLNPLLFGRLTEA